jgi:hypothetical protein
MSGDPAAKMLAGLRVLFDAVAEEASKNPAFAGKVEASLASALDRKGHETRPPRRLRKQSSTALKTKDKSEAHKMLHNVTFDPLECHIEAALLNGREQEVRAFLGKLDRAQLEEVVKVQRLPGAKSLQKAIQEAEQARAIDAIVGSAAEKVRSRYSAAN